MTRQHWKGDLRSVILMQVTENPKKQGSKARERFNRYRTGMTVGEYVEACRTAPRPNDALLDITWDSDPRRAFITLGDPGRSLEEA